MLPRHVVGIRSSRHIRNPYKSQLKGGLRFSPAPHRSLHFFAKAEQLNPGTRTEWYIGHPTPKSRGDEWAMRSPGAVQLPGSPHGGLTFLRCLRGQPRKSLQNALKFIPKAMEIDSICIEIHLESYGYLSKCIDYIQKAMEIYPNALKSSQKGMEIDPICIEIHLKSHGNQSKMH